MISSSIKNFSILQNLDWKIITKCLTFYIKDLEFSKKNLSKPLGLNMSQELLEFLYGIAVDEALKSKKEYEEEFALFQKTSVKKDKALAKKDEQLASAVRGFHEMGLKPTQIAEKLNLP
jgi:hypothetical protein